MEKVQRPDRSDRRRRLSPAVVAWLGALPLIAVLLVGVLTVRGRVASSDSGTLVAADQPAVGAAVPHAAVVLRGELLDGSGAWSSAAARGSVLVVNFWASWCPPCRAEQPGLNRVATAYQGRGVRFLGVNVNDGRTAARAYARELKIPYPSLYDRSARLAPPFGIFGLPTTLIIDRDGVLGYRFTGKTTESVLSARLDLLLASGGRWAA